MFYYIYPNFTENGKAYPIYNENNQYLLQAMRIMTNQGVQTGLLNTFGQELFAIRCMGNSSQIQLFQNGSHIGSVINENGYIRVLFSFANFQLTGHVFEHDYTIYQDDNIVGKVNRIQPYTSQYAIYIADSYPDPPFLCALSIAVDSCIFNL